MDPAPCVLIIISPHRLYLCISSKMFMFDFFPSCLPRCKRRKPRSLTSVNTTQNEPSPIKIGMTPGASKTRIPAVRVDESDMHSVLGAIFKKGTYEVVLDRDVYKITAPRKLTEVSGKA